MNPLKCARERDLAEILRQGFWPDACPPELRAHVETCRMCSDLVVVARAFQDARKEAGPPARLESAGALWWRAQLRRRNAAIETVARPIVGAQIFALVVSIVVGIAVVAWQGSTLKAWITDLPRALHLDALMPTVLSQSGALTWIILPVLAMVALLGGVVVYLSAEKQ
jgi:hypothetical protein